MANIRLHKDTLNPLSCEARSVGAINLLDWLHANAPWADVVIRNGVQLDGQADADVTLSEFDEVEVYAVPQGGVAALAWYWQVAIAVGIAAVAYALTPKPELPNSAGERKSSPNNQLNAANNEFRPRQALPHIYGSVRAYPDFIQPSYYEYEGDIKQITELFCVGVGYHTIENVRTSNTLIDDITGSSFTVYQPSDTVPDQRNVRSTNEITGQEMPYYDDVGGGDSNFGSTNISGSTMDGTAQTITLTENEFLYGFNFAGIELGDDITINVDYVPSGGGSLTSLVSQGTVADLTFNGTTKIWTIEVSAASPPLPSSNPETVSGTLSYQSPAGGGSTSNKEYYTLEGSNNTEVWFQVVAPQGLRNDTGGLLTVPIEIEVQQIDAAGNNVGVPVVQTKYLSSNSLNPLFRTYKVTGLTAGRYKAAATRSSIPSSDDNTVDVVNIEAIQSVEYYTPDFGDVTILEVVRRANKQESVNRSSKINCDATRELPIFDPVTGTFGARAATRSFAQAVMHFLYYEANEPLANIDYERLFEIEDSLSDPQLGYFDFTFDDKDVSVGQTLQTILNVARCYYYMVGNRYSFERDEAKPVRTMLFNRRNTLPEASEQSYTLYRSADYDSVEIKYVSPNGDGESYVRRRINATTGAIEDGLGDYVNEIDLAGCRNELQATNRAELEIRKIKYLWLQVKDTVTSEGLTVGLGQRVGWCDINDSEVQDGEILGTDGGNIFYTSEPVDLSGGATYYAYIVQSDGTVSNAVQIDSVVGNEYAFEAFGALSASIADGYEVQQGSLYVIAPLTGLNARDFTITRRDKPDENYNVGLEMVNYDERVYEMD